MPCSSGDFEWNDSTVQRLRALWAEGHSTAEIGRRLGVSKNAVVGKSHRLDLTARPSPIKAPGCGNGSRVRRPRCPTLAELQGRAACEPSAPPTVRAHSPPPRPIPAPVARDLPILPPPVAALRGNHPCCWPIGEPGESGFRFCNELIVEGKPYCPEHCDTAYPRWRRRRSAP